MSDSARQCGSCNVCCAAMKVTALNKPAGVRCEHMTDRGCGNYAHRPQVCRTWYCMWVRDGGRVFHESERPDKIGVFFSADKEGEAVVYAHETEPGSSQRPQATAAIERLAQFLPVQLIPARRPTTPLTRDGQPVPDAA